MAVLAGGASERNEKEKHIEILKKGFSAVLSSCQPLPTIPLGGAPVQNTTNPEGEVEQYGRAAVEKKIRKE